MVLRAVGNQNDREAIEGRTTESQEEKTQKVEEDTSKVERVEGKPGVPRQRADAEPRGLKRRVKDIRETFSRWDEAAVGRRNLTKDRRITQRRKGPAEQRGNSPRTHRRATDLSYVRMVTERKIDDSQPEGCGNVVAVGSRAGEPPQTLPEVTKRPEGTAEARLNQHPPSAPGKSRTPKEEAAAAARERAHLNPVPKNWEGPKKPFRQKWNEFWIRMGKALNGLINKFGMFKIP